MELCELKNIGAAMTKKLNAIGIHSAEELFEIGSKDAFFLMKEKFPNVCLVHLYCLQGAVDNLEYNQLPQEVKKELKHVSDRLK